MMMMSGFLERIINSPQMRCRSAKQVGLQMSNERQRGRVAVHRAADKTVPDDWARNRETSHPQRSRCPWYR